jgi:4-amino-4-deoxy-L-arabinose transferase-like glycosyltransferase
MRALPTFERGLVGVGLAALGLRVAAAFGARDHLVQGDAMVFHQVAQHLADGDGFMQAFRAEPTAEHPPGWEVVLAAADLAGGNGYLSHRLLGAVIGTVTVVLIGLVARRVAGPTVGLVAAALAAVYPMLWAADVSLMSETLYGALLVGALLLAVRLRDAATLRAAAALGGVLGLAALTRGEALLLVPLLLVPLTWRRWREMAVGVAAFVVVLAPWTIRNLATFEEPVLISGNANGIWVGANCPDTYSGELIGYWRFQCYEPERPGEDESQFYARQRDAGLEYAADNLDRLPAVVPVRVLRLLDAWDVEQSQFINAQEGRGTRATRWGIRMWWLLAPFAVAGALIVGRRHRWVLLAPVAMVLAVAAVTYGTTRFRFAAEPSVCVLAAVALVALRTRITQFQVATSRSPGTRVMNASRGQ